MGKKDKSKHQLKIQFKDSEDKTSSLSYACLQDVMNLNRGTKELCTIPPTSTLTHTHRSPIVLYVSVPAV